MSRLLSGAHAYHHPRSLIQILRASLTRNRFWWKSFSIKFVSKWPWKNEILLCWGQFPGLQHYIPLPTTFPKRRTGLENDAETFSMLCLALSLSRPQNLKDSPRLLSTSLYTLLVRKYEAASVDIAYFRPLLIPSFVFSPFHSWDSGVGKMANSAMLITSNYWSTLTYKKESRKKH